MAIQSILKTVKNEDYKHSIERRYREDISTYRAKGYSVIQAIILAESFAKKRAKAAIEEAQAA